jgi:hypothetical protein
VAEGASIDKVALGPRRLFLFTGLGCILLSTAQIAHFTISAALAGFPDMVLQAMWNWIFVAVHAVLGIAGLILLQLAWKKRGRETLPTFRVSVESGGLVSTPETGERPDNES